MTARPQSSAVGAPPLMPHRLAAARTDAELSFFVCGPMPGLNELLRKKGGTVTTKDGRTLHGVGYSGMKRKWQATVADALMFAGIGAQTPGVWRFEFVFRERDKRRDMDNIAAGARKFILDALQQCRVLSGDGWASVAGWSDSFVVVPADEAGVAVRMVRL